MYKFIYKKLILMPVLAAFFVITLSCTVLAAGTDSDISQILKKFQDTDYPMDNSIINSNIDISGDNMDTLDNALKTIYSEPAVSENYDKICTLFYRSNISGIKLFVDGKLIEFSKYDNVNPAIIDESTYVPIRAIAENLGATVGWDESTGTIKVQLFDRTIEFTVDSRDAWVDGSQVTMDAPARVIDGRTLVPVRFISESFSKTVEWHGYNDTLNVIAIY